MPNAKGWTQEDFEKVGMWKAHPAQFVRDFFGVEPDRWQVEVLEAFPHSPRLAMQACAGPGKTAVLAWIGWNFLVTRMNPIIGAAAISGQNLQTNLWTEMARWYGKSKFLQHFFDITKSEIFSREKREVWKMEARTWAKDANAEQIGNALRGLHSDNVMWLLDETGDFPASILPIIETIFSGNPTEAHIVMAGNPTSLSGLLHRACVLSRQYWKVVEITGDPDSPNRSPRIPVEHARQQISQYGRDNPWVLVNIFGKFPPSAFNALIGPDEVREAMSEDRHKRYQQRDIGYAARVLGVDVARFGDDASIIFPRQGLVAFPPHVLRNVDGIVGAGQVARVWEDWKVDATFIDSTGGYGASWIDQLRVLNRHAIPVGFGDKALNGKYANRRSEMAFETVEWIKRGGALPNDPELLAEISETTYTFKGDKLIIEPKDIIKQRIGRSPDKFDALMLTHAAPVAKAEGEVIAPIRQREDIYDPFAEALRA